jgi:hypothetical protein
VVFPHLGEWHLQAANKAGMGLPAAASLRRSEHLLVATYHENPCISKLKSIFKKDRFAK